MITRTRPVDEPAEFSTEDALSANWEEDGSDYLRLDSPEPPLRAEYSRASSEDSDRASSRGSRGRS